MDVSNFWFWLIFMILLIPYALILLLSFRYLRKDLKTTLNYSTFILFSLIGLYAYFGIILAISVRLMQSNLGDIIGATCLSILIYNPILIIPVFIFTIILAVRHFADRQKKNAA